MRRLVGFMILGCFSLTSCCTLTRNSHQPMLVSSCPPHAMVYVDGEAIGETPQHLELDAKRHHDILVTKEGYAPQHYPLRSKVSASKLSSNGWIVLGVGAVGILASLAIAQGTGPYFGALVLTGAVLSLAAGTVLGITGAGVDLCSKKARQLPTNHIHADLSPYISPLSCSK